MVRGLDRGFLVCDLKKELHLFFVTRFGPQTRGMLCLGPKGFQTCSSRYLNIWWSYINFQTSFVSWSIWSSGSSSLYILTGCWVASAGCALSDSSLPVSPPPRAAYPASLPWWDSIIGEERGFFLLPVSFSSASDQLWKMRISRKAPCRHSDLPSSPQEYENILSYRPEIPQGFLFLP